MPAPANRPPAARPPSRGPLVPLLAVLVLIAGAAALVYFLRRPKNPPAAPLPTAVAEATPGPTAAVSEPSAAPSATPADSRYHPPKVLTTRPVSYPMQALLNRVEGKLLVKFSIDETGKLSTPPVVVVSSGSVMLDAVVLEYDLRLWTFQPATLDGKPVPGTVDREFDFHLDKAEQDAMAAKRLAAKIGTPDAPYPKAALPLKVQGSCTISVTWTKGGLVDRIILTKASGSNILDRTALRYAFENWHIDPKDVVEGKEFSKTMTFTPPTGPNDTPPPLTTTAPEAPAPTTAPAAETAAPTPAP